MSASLAQGLRLPRPAFKSWSGWWSQLATTLVSEKGALPEGLLAGMLCDDAEQAFMAGYQLALARLVEGAPGHLRAFAVSEGAGRTLREMRTHLARSAGNADWILTGHKEFVTLPEDIEECLVLATSVPDETGESSVVVRLGRAQLARSLTATGLHPPGMQRVTFGKMTFSELPIRNAALLKGNGHEDYSKRFRWLEDHLVLMALQGLLIRRVLIEDGVADSRQARQDVERILASAAALQGQVTLKSPGSLEALVFAGVRDQMLSLFKQWRQSGSDALISELVVIEGLLSIAVQAQTRRAEKAWQQTLGG
ncbi:MAG: hypothetical protein IPM37_00200 [Hahellaceae bacterium]|nr:hypothetical protein [Hahellaceae bacterium]